MLLPDARRRGEIHFVIARSLPYGARLGAIVALLFAGLALQLYAYLAIGAVLLLAGSLLGIVKGYSNIPSAMGNQREWRGGDRKQLENILTLARKSRKWDQSLLDVTCGLGLFALLAIAGGTGWLAFRLWDAGNEWLAIACMVDAAVLLVPHWITGVRRILTNAPLVVKVQELLRVMDLWEAGPHAGESMLPQMQVRRGSDGEVPCDAKLVLRIEALGDAFLGVQTQVVLNNVQGRDYPYLYCVLVARPELGMLGKTFERPPKGIIAEPKQAEQDNVEIMVIRQVTSRTKGYHTPPAACAAIFSYSLQEARKLVPAKAASLAQ
jgi:hypothetical protein